MQLPKPKDCRLYSHPLSVCNMENNHLCSDLDFPQLSILSPEIALFGGAKTVFRGKTPTSQLSWSSVILLHIHSWTKRWRNKIQDI